MNPEFPELLIKLINDNTLSLEYVRGWAKRFNENGKFDNLDYIELLNALNEYERTQPK